MDAQVSFPPAVRLQQLIIGKWVSQAIHVAAELGIADLLRDGAKTSDELADRLSVSPDALYRVLRALGSVGVLEESEGRHFASTELGELLRADVPGSLRGFARFVGHESTWKPWGEIHHSVKTGAPAFDQVFQTSFFAHASRDSGAAEVFNEAMTSVSSLEAEAVAAAFEFAGVDTLLDVAGGHGLLLATVLQSHPAMKGILFEMEHALPGARTLLSGRGLSERIRVEGGDFFDRVPAGADACLLKHIVHDWDDERAVRILKNCRAALRPGAKLLVVEVVLPPPGEPHYGKLLDLEMLLLTPHGRERTAGEFERLFRQAGFELTRVIPTASPVSIVEGV